MEPLLLSYSYKISDRLDHFSILELKVKISKNVKETLAEIEDNLTDYNVEIKNIKRPNKDESDTEEEVIKIVGEYNNKGFKKNELLRTITSLKNVNEVSET